jgi:hypothetical protein
MMLSNGIISLYIKELATASIKGTCMNVVTIGKIGVESQYDGNRKKNVNLKNTLLFKVSFFFFFFN